MSKHKEVNSVEKQVKKMKKRMKKLCCCAFWWSLFGILSLFIGIGLLAKFAKHWNDDDKDSERVAAYIGLVLLLIGMVILTVGIVMCVALYYVYKRTQNAGSMKQFKAPTFPPGEAPYPQQPVYNPVPSNETAGNPQPSAPYPPSAPSANPQDVSLHVTEHHKF